MREIKCRAWDKHNKEMLRPEIIESMFLGAYTGHAI